MKHLKGINESQTFSSYEEALDKMCKYMASRIHDDYMGGSMSPRYGGERGVIDTLSILYSRDKKQVSSDINTMLEEYRTKKRDFRD
jgi:hypothetical protein